MHEKYKEKEKKIHEKIREMYEREE